MGFGGFFKNRIKTKPADVQFAEPVAAPQKIDWLAVIRLADRESDFYAATQYGIGEMLVAHKREELTLSGEYRPERDMRGVSTADPEPEPVARKFFDHVCTIPSCGLPFKNIKRNPQRCPHCLGRQT